MHGNKGRRPTFEPPLDLRSELLFEGTFKDKEMDIDSGNAPTRATRPWILGKFIPQALQAPKYVISTPRIEEHKQYMDDYALVGKFLGLWHSKRELV